MNSLVLQTQPQLLDLPGVGPVGAATILTAWSHPGRVRSETALASLAGTCPVSASSGSTIRYRLNRSGDRQLNKAIHTIAIVRMRSHPDTREYVQRRTAEGRNKKEIGDHPQPQTLHHPPNLSVPQRTQNRRSLMSRTCQF
ncbi:transposase [Arthrobacter russicus]|uniref:transposase n=1 Tax=Arthrobacter russicus TaxID=172040 RepID=UPI0035B51225